MQRFRTPVGLVLGMVAAVGVSARALAQPEAATLRVTVLDPSGAVIVGAHVTVQPPGTRGPLSTVSDGRGDATFAGLEPGRYQIHVESPGFEPRDEQAVRVRSGETRRQIKMSIAKLSENVQVTRDPRERASDPRSDAFATILGQAEINELPNDPDEMEQALKDMAGPGATIRVNGFRGGRLPPKDQIQQIRFRRNMFAADMHEPGFITVDIITKPGLESWRGSTNVGFRDSALNARNPFAPTKGDEQSQRYSFSLNGPLWQKHTSMSLSADGLDAFDSKTIVAALPAGPFSANIRRPNDAMNFSARLEHALSKTQVLRGEVQRNHRSAENLGVGDYDLPERGYSQAVNETVARLSTSGSLRKSLFNELRLQWRLQDTAVDPVSTAPAVLVLNAFDNGGAQLSGPVRSNEVTIADDLDVASGRHAARVGFLVEGGRYTNAQLRNTGGTFTFASLDAFNAARPTTFAINVGNPYVEVSQVQEAIYAQDDIRVRKDLTLSAGIRQEAQSRIGGLHVGPRGGITWSPFRSGSTTIRAGGGVFFDWFDAQSYAQVVQLDGDHQRIRTVVEPGYPDPIGGSAVVLPPGRVQLAQALAQPQLREAIVGVERRLPGDIRLNTMYIHRHGMNQLRGVNINAPRGDGTIPDPSAGPITQIESIASSDFDALSFNVNWAQPQKRMFLAANYMLSRSINETDTPFSLPADTYNLAAERGPSLTDATHRFMSLANVPLSRHFRLGTSLRVQSALPYNITTGHDDNGDTISNDRPPGVTRNSARGQAQVDLGGRLSWSTSFGPPRTLTPGAPQVRIVRGGDADPLSNMSMMGAENKRFGFELYAQAYNLLNHTNLLNFSGVMTSPFFGQATSALPARRVEIGARLNF